VTTTDRLGERSVLTCPECSGVLWEIRDDALTRYRCHTGHAYTLESLSHFQMTETERALASAMRALEERVLVVERLASDAHAKGHTAMARQWDERAEEYRKQAALIRGVLLQRLPLDRLVEPQPAGQ
jgi:two-component system chemotaxis response regulator CheB